MAKKMGIAKALLIKQFMMNATNKANKILESKASAATKKLNFTRMLEELADTMKNMGEKFDIEGAKNYYLRKITGNRRKI